MDRVGEMKSLENRVRLLLEVAASAREAIPERMPLLVRISAHSNLRDLVAGALAGSAATVPMTATMEFWYRRLPEPQQHPLPPREITMNVAEKAGVKQELNEPQRLAATLLGHFGMGTAAGMVYGLVGRSLPLPRPVAGALFGLAVWAINYTGLMPALGLVQPTTERSLQRSALLVGAHLVWGVTLASAFERLRRPV